MKAILTYISLITSLVSCINKLHDNNKTLENYTNSDTLIHNIRSDSIDFEAIIVALKERYYKFSTSGVLSVNETIGLCKPNRIGFFGGYNLIDDVTLDRIGYLKVFFPGNVKDWKFENKKESFAELILFKGNYILFDSIKIGQAENDLMKKISIYNPEKIDNNISFKLLNLFLRFEIQGDTISRINIRKICNN